MYYFCQYKRPQHQILSKPFVHVQYREYPFLNYFTVLLEPNKVNKHSAQVILSELKSLLMYTHAFK